MTAFILLAIIIITVFTWPLIPILIIAGISSIITGMFFIIAMTVYCIDKHANASKTVFVLIIGLLLFLILRPLI